MGVIKRKPRTPPWPPHPAWSSAKWWGFLRSKLRAAYTRWPPKHEVMAEARRAAPKGKRHKWEFRCAQCEGWFLQKNVEVDHIIPCGKLQSFSDLPGFVERLFCGKEGLRVLCKTCHTVITNKERGKTIE